MKQTTDKREEAEKTPLTRQAIVDRALALASADGLEAVTIRRLAKDLGVTPMALYWHFRNKDELLDGMVSRIYEKIDPQVDQSATWQEQLRTLLGSMIEVLRENPSTVNLLATRNTASEANLRAIEITLDILRRAGFSPEEATQVARQALSTITDLISRVHATVPQKEPGELLDAQRRTRVFLESLPPERYPRIVEAAGPLSTCDDPDAYYAFGLDLLMAGIETMAARKR